MWPCAAKRVYRSKQVSWQATPLRVKRRCGVAGVQVLVDIQTGHKTGLYLDQRENYEILRQIGVFG